MKQRDRSRRFFARPEGRGRGSRARSIPRWFWVAAGLWLAWVTVISDHSFWRIAQLKREIVSSEHEAERLKRDTEELERQVSDPEARKFRAEEIARTQHGWAAPGEIVYRFRGAEPAIDTTR
ncbi:MAG TPA: septum formation initiator family protein [Methylomirabilota bacterium]|jgi:cell division protein FtsB|nr:septum formation initiator family protein [Methylomirabilota bacterium]